MLELLAKTDGSSGPLNIVLLFGLIVFGGTLGSKLAQKVNIPQLVGAIITGILLGNVANIIHSDLLHSLEPFTMFALGIIGFMIGGELRADAIKKYGRQFFIILFSQGLVAFLLVWIGAGAVIYFFTRDFKISLAMGLLLGAIASATAPAATVNVLWEFKTRGPLTSAIYAIVALDDGLALLLYRAAGTGVKIITGAKEASILTSTGILLAEIIGAIILGFIVGLVFYLILKYDREEDHILAYSIAALLLIVGVSMAFKIEPILPTMTFGITIANMAPRQSKGLFTIVRKFTPPIYIAFFVLAGAHVEFGELTTFIVVAMIAYILLRAIGKVWGSWLGAKWSKAPAMVKRYLGICLLPQAGVAIGLAILSGHYFEPEYAKIIIIVVMTSSFFMEIIGPMLVHVGVKKAKEIGMNVTEEDLIKQYNVSDVMKSNPVQIPMATPLQEILDIFSKTDAVYYPVVDDEKNLLGIITVSGIKEMFASQDVAGWLLAIDVAEPVRDKVYPDVPLEDALELMTKYDLQNLPVVTGAEVDKLEGILNQSSVNRDISAEVLRRRREADELTLAAE